MDLHFFFLFIFLCDLVSQVINNYVEVTWCWCLGWGSFWGVGGILWMQYLYLLIGVCFLVGLECLFLVPGVLQTTTWPQACRWLKMSSLKYGNFVVGSIQDILSMCKRCHDTKSHETTWWIGTIQITFDWICYYAMLLLSLLTWLVLRASQTSEGFVLHWVWSTCLLLL